MTNTEKAIRDRKEIVTMTSTERRVRNLMDLGYDFTNGEIFRSAFKLSYKYPLSNNNLLSYGTKYQNELEAQGAELPWKQSSGGSPKPRESKIKNHPSPEFAATLSEIDSIGEPMIGPSSSFTSNIENLIQNKVAEVVTKVNRVAELVKHPDDMYSIIAVIEDIGIKQFKATYRFVQDIVRIANSEN